MDLHLGFFANFNGSDSLLLEGSSLGIENLVSVLCAFMYSAEESLPIHTLASVASRHPVQLFATRVLQRAVVSEPPRFAWQLSSGELPNIQEKLLELAHSPSGHQYFDIVGSSAQLIVSVGEYGESWWRAHG